jgi:hypothetical protein
MRRKSASFPYKSSCHLGRHEECTLSPPTIHTFEGRLQWGTRMHICHISLFSKGDLWYYIHIKISMGGIEKWEIH